MADMSYNNVRQKVLITDDSDINRMILKNILEEEYDVFEAEDGVKALEVINEHKGMIDLVLLDCVMPNKDGFQTLSEMNRLWWQEDIPVIMISAENDQAFIVRAYKLGAADYITRPFNAIIVKHRVDSIMRMHMKEQQFADIAASQIIDKHQNNSMMIHILGGIVEFRNGESGLHIMHVEALTNMFMRELINVSDIYRFTPEEMSMIPTAAALHDIGKISVPYNILNKPGRLTDEEFEIMKNHTVAGFDMLTSIEVYRDDPLIILAGQVCRWHHERYDGSGYPDGIKGEAIPIAAQLVSIADVYDALTSKRCYKDAYSHEDAVRMILNGECGQFNPLLIKCLENLADTIPERLAKAWSPDALFKEDMHRIIENTLRPSKNLS